MDHHLIIAAMAKHLLNIVFLYQQLNIMMIMGLDRTLMGQLKIAVNPNRKPHYINFSLTSVPNAC